MHVGKKDIYFDQFDPAFPLCPKHTEDIVTCEKTEECIKKCPGVMLLELGTEKSE